MRCRAFAAHAQFVCYTSSVLRSSNISTAAGHLSYSIGGRVHMNVLERLQRLRSIFSRKVEDSSDTPRFIRPHVPVFPNDGEDPLVFPPLLDTPEKKVIYALWARGQQPYEHLCLETQIPPGELDLALKSLVTRGRVEQRFLGPGTSPDPGPDDPENQTDPWVFTMYSLVSPF